MSKAIGYGALVSIILGLVVIVVMLTQLTQFFWIKQGIDDVICKPLLTSNFEWWNSFLLWYCEGKTVAPFEPFVGPELTKEEVSVFNSLNALVCGVNSVSKGGKVSEDYCSGVERFDEGSYFFGGTKLKCEGLSGSNFLLVKDKFVASRQIAELAPECWRESQKFVDRGSFSGVENFICYRLEVPEGLLLTETDVINVLPEVRGGKDLTGRFVDSFDMGDLQGPGKVCMVRTVGLISSGNIVVKDCPVVDKDRRVSKSFEMGTALSAQPRCVIENFKLPQEVSLGGFVEAISGYGDPKYLVYYEKFPEGEDAYWKVAQISQYGWNIGIAGVTSLFFNAAGPVLGRLFKGAATVEKEVMKQALKEALGEAAESALKSATKEGVEVAFRRKALEEVIDAAKDLPAAKESYKKAFAEIMDGLVKNNPGKSEAELFKEGVLQFNRLLKDEEKKVLKEGLEFAAEESLEKVLKKAQVKTFLSSLTEETAKNALKESDKLAKFLNKLPKDQADKILKEATEASIEASFEHGVFAGFRGMGDEAIDQLIQRTMPEATESVLKQLLESSSKTVRANIDVLSAVVPTSGFIGPISPVTLKWASKFGIPYFTPRSQITKWLWGKRYTFLVGLYLYSHYIEGLNEKFSPHGINSLSVSVPSYGLEKSRTFQLESSVLPYYLTLFNQFKDDAVSERFYLASPCASNLILRKTQCKCPVRPGSSVLMNFGGGPQQVNPATIVYKTKISNDVGSQIDQLLKRPSYQQKLRTENEIVHSGGKRIKLGEIIDYSNVIKECADIGLIDKASFYLDENEEARTEFLRNILGYESDSLARLRLAWEPAEVQCIVAEVDADPYEGKDLNYCYPRYPKSEAVKKCISRVAMAGDIALSIVTVVTGGSASVFTIPAIVFLNMGDAALTTAITQHLQKWPLSEKKELSLIEKGLAGVIKSTSVAGVLC